MAISYTQSRNVYSTGVTSVGLAFNSNVSAGNPCLIVGAYDGNGAGDTSLAVSDNVNAGNYAKDLTANLATDDDTQGIFSKPNAASGATTVTVSRTNAGGSLALAIHEYAGIATNSPFDQSASANNTNTSPSSGNTGTTTTANELVFGWMGLTGAVAETVTAGGGATKRETIINGNPFGVSSELIVSSTGAQSGSFTLSTSQEWACLCATYKGASVAAPFIPVNGDGPAFRKTHALDFSPPNLLAEKTLPLPPIIQADQLYKVQFKGVYIDFAPPNLLLSTLVPTPKPLASWDLSQQVKFSWGMVDFIPPNLSPRLPYPPVLPQDLSQSLRVRSITDSPVVNQLILSVIVNPLLPQDTSQPIRRTFHVEQPLPNLLFETLAPALAAPLLPQDISGSRIDAKGLRSDFIIPNLTLTLPNVPPVVSTGAGRHGSRAEAERRRQKDVLRAQIQSFEQQRRSAEQALESSESREVRVRAQTLKRVRVLKKPLEEYVPVKRAIEKRAQVASQLRDISNSLARAKAQQAQLERELDEEAAVHFIQFLMGYP